MGSLGISAKPNRGALMSQKTIVMIEDDEDIIEVVSHILKAQQYHVSTFTNGEDGLRAAISSAPDLILLDVMLPGKSGLEICTELKGNSRTASVPIVMLTAKQSEDDIVKGLEAGADDYIVKPFRQKELLARLQSVLRRNVKTNPATATATLKVQGIVLDPQKRVVAIDGEKVDLTFSEFGILQCLLANPGWVYTRSQIVSAIRGDGYFVTDRTVDVQVVGLRRKLGKYETCIETVRGVGYRFADS